MGVETGEVTLVFQKGKKCDVEWKIREFLFLSEEIDAFYWSSYFCFEDESWYLEIYPNGSVYLKSDKFIHLRLHRLSSNGPPINVEFCFSLKTVNGKKDLEAQRTGVFKGNSWRDVHRFISRSNFKKRQSEFLDSGSLTVVCTLKRIISTEIASTNTDEKCFCCKETLDVEFISLHEKCIAKSIKCPDCSDVIPLMKWLNGHECQKTRTEGGINASGSPKVCHHDKILHDFKQLLLIEENCDVILRVKGREFQAHKAILTVRSPVFASTFRNDMKEKKTGIVDIEDCDPSIFPDVLCFIYSDDVGRLSEENVFGLFNAADKYDIPDLRKMCLEFMKENISVEIFCETLTLALQHSETELIHLATDFFIRNAEKILVTVKWQSFAAENPTKSNELFIKFVSSVRGPNM